MQALPSSSALETVNLPEIRLSKTLSVVVGGKHAWTNVRTIAGSICLQKVNDSKRFYENSLEAGKKRRAVEIYLDVVLLANFLLHKESLDCVALVTLELQHLSVRLLVLEHCSVATMLLLDRLQNLFEVQLLGKASHGCNGLAAVALLDADMYSTLFKSDPACSF